MIRKDGKERMDTLGRVVQVNNNMHGSRSESWATPRAGCPGSRAPGTGGKVLEEQVKEPKAWATPRAEMDSGAHRGKPDTLHSQMKAWATLSALDGQRPTETMQEWEIRNAKKKAENPNLGTLHKPLTVQVSGKLNPRWVEALQGLPIGWTMPSCASPVTIAPTSCASLATE
jgi:hypothetical protein